MMVSRGTHQKFVVSMLSALAAASLVVVSGCAGAPPPPGEGLRSCGVRAGEICAADEYCDFPDDLCGAADVPGVCVKRPQVCTREYNPTRGCDGRIHDNPCVTHADGTDISKFGCE